jgi:hypothetical protein
VSPVYVFVLYVFFADGTQDRVPLAIHQAPARCAELLVKGTAKPVEHSDRVDYVILACEEEKPRDNTN